VGAVLAPAIFKGINISYKILVIGLKMATTIQVKDETMRLLEALKQSMDARSFDEVLRILLSEKLGVKREMFGVDRGKLKPFTEADRLEDRDADRG